MCARTLGKSRQSWGIGNFPTILVGVIPNCGSQLELCKFWFAFRGQGGRIGAGGEVSGTQQESRPSFWTPWSCSKSPFPPFACLSGPGKRFGNFEDFCSSDVSKQSLFPRRCWGRYSELGADLPVSASEMKHEERLERSALPSSLQLLFNLEIAFEKELELLHAEVQSESRNWLSKRKKKRNRNFINGSN